MKEIKNGLIDNNPVFVQLLGMCPTLAVTTSLENAIGMGLSATAVLMMSNIFISLLRRFIPDKVRIAGYIVVIAGFVTVVDLCLQAYFHSLAGSLGIFIPLIVVNCIILARAEAFASKNGVVASALDGIGMGLGFTVALSLIASVREILGSGTFFGLQVLPQSYPPMLIMALAPGGFLTLGLLLAALNAARLASKSKAGATK